MLNTIVISALTASLLLTPVGMSDIPAAGRAGTLVAQNKKVILASETMDLSYRYPVESVSKGFKENILVNLYHFSKINSGVDERGTETNNSQVDVPSNFAITLNPGEVFAFHDKISSEFSKDKVITPNSGYGANDGYILISGLYGNGVCHLATLMNYVAQKAGVEVVALTRHDFAAIPGFDREYGTSISYGNCPERQNLYIKNNKEYPLDLGFTLAGDNLIFTISLITS